MIRHTRRFFVFAIFIILLLVPSFNFSEGYYVRMVYETTKSGTMFRSEEVYESGDIKVVFVTSPESFTWVRVKDKYYIGNTNNLTRTFQIRDLADIAYEYVRSKKLDISVDGVYKFSEDTFSLEIFVVSGEIIRIFRKVGDVSTTMYINKLPKQFDMKSILSKFTLVENPNLPEEVYNLNNIFLWASVSEGKGYIRISGYDKEGKPLEMEINKTSGDFKIGSYYLKILKATEKTQKEIKNALRGN
ncbi:MAG: hypothetical protein WHS64_06920 [Fervidobacterium sp.]|uniref:DUF4340 domain-containing protein n=1 Tax=Fervidobacterium gondwanense DSM 13020 TaxID=1121883 RepID=A0A1M7T5F7_FERGO|nr:hypothetical protein [Fervidobacterium gondwanense]UXF00712.1 hypothetical protein IB67_03855 [Fervidobacterium riparium]SHN65954.1 hypothetical protein SAMN02745226_01566 [Fervidobacterium gondwanense DSM 13020]